MVIQFSRTQKPYIIAEIGNNHQGNLDIALKMIESAKMCGVNAVKFQKRCNKNLFTDLYYGKPYDNPNSFGETYGEHRDNLELDICQILTLKKAAEILGLDFLVTPFDFESLNLLETIDCKFYKIASADIVHSPLIQEICKLNKPIILSTGHAEYKDIDRAYKIFEKYSTQNAILHCTAAYPTPLTDMNLNCIPKLIEKYPKSTIGLSDHENGIGAAPIAYMLGARIFEKHFTLDHAMKGTDNAFSLMPNGMRKLVRNLNRIDEMLGGSEKTRLASEERPVYKMRKSIVYKKKLLMGHKIKMSDLEFRCPGDGLEPYFYEELVGKTLNKDVERQQLTDFTHFGEES